MISSAVSSHSCASRSLRIASRTIPSATAKKKKKELHRSSQEEERITSFQPMSHSKGRKATKFTLQGFGTCPCGRKGDSKNGAKCWERTTFTTTHEDNTKAHLNVLTLDHVCYDPCTRNRFQPCGNLTARGCVKLQGRSNFRTIPFRSSAPRGALTCIRS